jgi:hypothetical protein
MRLLPLAYVIAGAFVAAGDHYFRHVGSFKAVASAVLAILLWPLVLLGVDLRIN